MMQDRKGQVISHVFIFLIGAFVMAAIMLLGWRAITTMQTQQCTAQEATFVDDIGKAINSNLGRGKTRTITFSLPCGSDQVCFIARQTVDDAATSGSVSGSGVESYPTIEASVLSGDPANIFLRVNGKYEPLSGMSVGAPIALQTTSTPGITCIDGEDIEATLEGTGQEVLISPAAP